MNLKITLDIFSGRPNPELIVSDAEAKKVLDAIRPVANLKSLTAKSAKQPGNLGYRGIIVEQLGRATKTLPGRMHLTHNKLFSTESTGEIDGQALESLVISQLSKFRGIGNKKEFKIYLEQEMKRFKGLSGADLNPNPPDPPEPADPVNPCACAPDADIAWWNDGGVKQGNNNCYNYACNYRTNTFAQPGLAAGQQYTSMSGCTVAAGQRSVKEGAVLDQLIDKPTANNVCPGKGHLVALVIAPGHDFHWYRKGPTGYWSHKPGSTAARNMDEAGKLITDPRTADRGSYTQFCTFMQVLHGHIMIK